MTFDEILEASYDDQGYQISGSISPNPSADVIARFKRWTNEAHRDLLGRPRLAALRHSSFPIGSVPGESVYFIAQMFDVIDAIVQQTNDIRLQKRTRDWYRSIDPGERSQGTPYVWIEEGYGPVGRQPEAVPLWVASTNPLDVTQTVHVQGSSNSAGYDRMTGLAALNGTTPVQVSGSAAWGPLRSVYLDQPCLGDVVLADAPVPTRLFLIIQRDTTSTQYHLIRLWPTPSAAETYLVDGQLCVRDLVSPNDVPFLIPALYHPALVDYVNYRAYEKNGDSARAQVSRANYERRLNDLTNKIEFSADFRPVRGGLGPDARRWSNLPGGWFPADGWGR